MIFLKGGANIPHISAVTFYRIEPKGQLVLGLRKASVTPPSHKVWHTKLTLSPSVCVKQISVLHE